MVVGVGVDGWVTCVGDACVCLRECVCMDMGLCMGAYVWLCDVCVLEWKGDVWVGVWVRSVCMGVCGLVTRSCVCGWATCVYGWVCVFLGGTGSYNALC